MPCNLDISTGFGFIIKYNTRFYKYILDHRKTAPREDRTVLLRKEAKMMQFVKTLEQYGGPGYYGLKA